MRIYKTQIAALILGCGLAFTAGAAPHWDHEGEYSDIRQIVDRTQGDLRAASDLEHGGKQANRYKEVQDHLSDFDRSLSKGHFNKDRMDRAIEDLKHLLDHNTLQASYRDALLHDIDDLRVARDHHIH